MRSFFHHQEVTVSRSDMDYGGSPAAHTHTPVYTCQPVINHHISSCHKVTITFTKRLSLFLFDIWNQSQIPWSWSQTTEGKKDRIS